MEAGLGMTALADTGYIFAIMDEDDAEHDRSLDLYRRLPDRILLPTTALPEIAFLTARAGGSAAVAAAIRTLRASDVEFIDPLLEDYDHVAEILEKYADSRIDFVDATIMAIAERLNITRILTLDRRDFGIYRPRHCDYFELLP
jgi:predicted nucleic acid-binding protein